MLMASVTAGLLCMSWLMVMTPNVRHGN
jgi:hypothetical protein